MNKVIQTIATVMIVLLLAALIWVFLSYFEEDNVIDTITFSSGDESVSTPGIPNENYIIPNQVTEGENHQEEYTSGNEMKSGDETSENSGDTRSEIPNDTTDLPEGKREIDTQILISSSPETSNEEKQEVLNEIDKALKGLLEAVGKVEVVDETRLDATLNSEVEVP